MKIIVRQYALMVLIVLVTGFLGASLSTQFFEVESAFAKKAAPKKQPSQTFEQKIAEIEKKIDVIEKAVNIEGLATKKLVEISEKNLSAPSWVIGVMISLIVVGSGLLTVAIFIIRKEILDRIETQISKINTEWNKHKERIDGLVGEHKKIKAETNGAIAIFYTSTMVREWQRGRLNQAIRWGEGAVTKGIEAWGEDPEDSHDKERLNRSQSNLAYVYAEKERTDKDRDAIDYAKLGLETGCSLFDLELIDNYLFVIKTFSEAPEDEKQWLKIFEKYKADIYARGIRKEGEEQEEYNKHYERLKKRHSTAE